MNGRFGKKQPGAIAGGTRSASSKHLPFSATFAFGPCSNARCPHRADSLSLPATSL
jgi:hypothetical protein